MQPLGDQQQNLLYLYDLPKDSVNETKIGEAFKSIGIILEQIPKINRHITSPFYNAIINIRDSAQFEIACEKMRYFEIDGKQCRGLQFDRQLLGSNKEKLQDNNVFVSNVPKEWRNIDLHNKFSSVGLIKSLKISLNPDHTSKGFGYICFVQVESVPLAIDLSKNDETAIANKFQPKDGKQFKKVNNNVYVKNIPMELTIDNVKELFGAYGNISSVSLTPNQEIGSQFGFVCYQDPDGKNFEYGPECAAAAIEGLSGKDMGNDLKLYIRQALKKSDREREKRNEILRYKASKKRCNLYVKNFPSTTSEEDLEKLFGVFGPIEKIKLCQGKSGNAFAFVCYKTPDSAANAKSNLHNHTYEGKALVINFYEIKEVRQIQIEAAIGKADYEKYQAQQSSTVRLNDLTSHPHMTQILQQLLQIMQENQNVSQHLQNNDRRQRYQGGGYQQRGGYHQRGGHHGEYQQRGGHQNYQNHNQNQNQMPQHHSGPPQNMPQPQFQQQIPQPMPSAGQGQMPGGPGMHNNVQPAVQNVNPIIQEYLATTQKWIPSVQERNPFMKENVGQAIYKFVTNLVPVERAPKITGMLIELPVDQIKGFMSNWDQFVGKVTEANTLLENSEKADQTQQ